MVASNGNGSAATWDIASGKQTRIFAANGAAPGDARHGHRRQRRRQLDRGQWRPSVSGRGVGREDRRTALLVLVERLDLVFGLEWSPDGDQLAIAEGPNVGGRIAILNRSGIVIQRSMKTRRSSSTGSAFSPNGRLLLAHRFGDPINPEARVWDIAAGRPIGSLPAAGQAIAFDPIGTRIVTSGPPSTDLEVWDSDTLQKVRTVATPTVTVDLAYSRQGDLVATAGADGIVRVWDTDMWVQRASLRGHQTFLRDVDFSPDESTAALAGRRRCRPRLGTRPRRPRRDRREPF